MQPFNFIIMSYNVSKNLIYADKEYFDPYLTLTCGQLFRYKCFGDVYEVISADKKCVIKQTNDTVIIDSNDSEYFVNYFDLNTDYAKISNFLKNFPELTCAVESGKGIRILRQDLYETIISFIISANNNISRIRKIISSACLAHGINMGDYHAFFTVKQGTQITEQQWRSYGAGFRAPYLVSTCNELSSKSLLSDLPKMDYFSCINALTQLKGVGRKVADCVSLFALAHRYAYPVDTWIFKSGKTDELNTVEKVRNYYTTRYGEFAGYAQQYIFNFSRTKSKSK